MPRDSGWWALTMQTGTSVWLNDAGCNIPGLAIYRQIRSISRFHSESLLAAAAGAGRLHHRRAGGGPQPGDFLTADNLPVLDAAAPVGGHCHLNAQLHEQTQQLREATGRAGGAAPVWPTELHDAVTVPLFHDDPGRGLAAANRIGAAGPAARPHRRVGRWPRTRCARSGC